MHRKHVPRVRFKSSPRLRRSGVSLPAFFLSISLVVGIVHSAHAENRLLSLRVVPEEVTLWGARASQHFLVLGQFADGLERDVTPQSRLSISNPDLARTSETGLVVAGAEGETLLKAELEDKVATARIRIEGVQEDRAMSFQEDVLGVLTRQGCNTSECHGSVKGKGGFKLSLNALRPGKDYRWIADGGIYQVLTAEAGGKQVPRINLKQPEQSLLLLKASGGVPHAGGQRFDAGSPDYQAILDWIRGGAIYEGQSVKGSKRTQRVEVLPRIMALDSEGKHRLLVIAHFSDGRREDLTHKVHYQSGNPEVATVTAQGLVEAVKPGETSIMVQTPGLSMHVRVGVVAQAISDYPEQPRHNLIDDHVFTKLRTLHTLPSTLSTDEEFLRRVCLDVTGTLPPPGRVLEFLSSEDPQKRDKLIDILLNSPEYVDYWVFRFADLFRLRGIGAGSARTTFHWEWIRRNIAVNRPYDEMIRERVSSQGYDRPSRFYLAGYKARSLEKMVTEDVRVFMGRRLDCAQCHDHPFDLWSQDQFWGLAAFYSRLTSTELRGDRVLFDDSNGEEVDFGKIPGSLLAFKKAINPRTKEEVSPRFLDGTVLPEETRHDPRLGWAHWMTSHPYFAEAIVNRMWSYFFGRGIVEPVDNFQWTNPPTHPGLLTDLARDFRDHGHDLKHLIRRIVSSRTYQLASAPNRTNRSDKINYSHAFPRALDAEILLDAISTVTGVPVIFQDSKGGKTPPGTRAIQLREPFSWPSQFLEIHGRPFRDSVPERDRKPNLSQALHRLAGSTYTQHLAQPGGRIDQLLGEGASNQEAIEEIYLAAFSRFPTQQEQAGLEKLFRGRSSLVVNSFFSDSRIRREVIEDLLWSVISSREFAYNH